MATRRSGRGAHRAAAPAAAARAASGAKNDAAPVAKGGRPQLVRVRAIRNGYHSGLMQRYKEGAVFDYPLKPGESLPAWVERAQGRVTQKPDETLMDTVLRDGDAKEPAERGDDEVI